VTENLTHPTQWIVTERALHSSRHTELAIAQVTLPDGVKFEQPVLRITPAAMCVVVDEENRVLMMRRHRFVMDRWMWELPGGYLDDPAEDPAACAAREAEEETGWRPTLIEHLVSYQPMSGTADAPQHVFLGREPVYVAHEITVDVNEAEQISWIPLAQAVSFIANNSLGSASVIGLLAAREHLGLR